MKTRFVLRPLVLLLAWIAGCSSVPKSALPAGYQGKPFHNSVYRGGAQIIPGRVECAYYDLGGEGVAYHDTDASNNGSGVLNQQKNHQRPHATPYHWNFRTNEGVDVSYTKDFADFNHGQNLVSPPTNQFYIGWTENGEWCNYTVNIKTPGRYKIIALYGHTTNAFKFSINHQPAAEGQLPVATGSFHKWNRAEVGTITFPQAGLNLLTLHYNKGNNFAYFDFEKIPGDATAEMPKPAPAPRFGRAVAVKGRAPVRFVKLNPNAPLPRQLRPESTDGWLATTTNPTVLTSICKPTRCATILPPGLLNSRERSMAVRQIGGNGSGR